jgi:hypothetical protein
MVSNLLACLVQAIAIIKKNNEDIQQIEKDVTLLSTVQPGTTVPGTIPATRYSTVRS